ncbi:MAG: TIM barrel protein [archaeon]
MIKFGPSGLGGAKEAINNLKKFHKAGLKACEVAFTYSVYLNKEQAKEIGSKAKELGIQLTIHAQYWINLNSLEKTKVEASMKRILKCCEIGHYLGAKYVVFHAAFYQKKEPKEVYEIVKKRIIEMQKIIKKNNWKIKLAPETTGKKSQFGSLTELLQLVKDTSCFLCIDFAHLEARDQKINYDEIVAKLKQSGIKNFHCHFSGIEYGLKGERRHKLTTESEWRELLKNLKKSGLNFTIVNESPDPFGDALKGLKILS